MTKPLLDWDPSLLRRGPRSHSSWFSKVESVHGYFGGDWAEEHSESFDLDQLPIVITNRLEQVVRLRSLEEQVSELVERLDQVDGSAGIAGSKTATIQTFAPESYALSSPIAVEIASSGAESFVASFFDANISTTGDNEQEAFDNLKSLILDTFDSLNREELTRLGPEPRRQLAVLRSFIRVA